MQTDPETRSYQKTHTWITFKFNIQDYRYTTWLLLGRVQAKCKYIATSPFLPEVRTELQRLYLWRGIHATTAIEGNTLSEDQVRRHLEGKLTLPPSQEYQGQEITNVEALLNQIGNEILTNQGSHFSVDRIKHYHKQLLHNLPLGEDVIPGEIRQHSVTVGRYLGAPAEDCEYLLQCLCDWLNKPLNAPKGYKAAFKIWQAIVAHIYFAWIHPFADGNGRIARLIEFEILLRSGIPDIAAHLLSNHYNRTRDEYYRQLDAASRSGGDLEDFVAYALQGLVDGLNEQMERIQAEQLRVHWRNFVHRRYDNSSGNTVLRKRHLLLDLSDADKPIHKSDIRHLSTRLALDYHDKSDKTLQRDLNELESEGLIIIEDGMVRANLNILVAFLPLALGIESD